MTMQRRELLRGLAALGAAAGAAAAATPSFAAAAPVARHLAVDAVQMPAWVDVAGERRPLSPGDEVSTQQAVETGAEAALVLSLPEGSVLRLGEKTRLEVPQLAVAHSLDAVEVKSRLKLVDGFFRFTTSAVAHVVGKRDVELTVRTATIGVRGTDFWSMTDAVHDAACLFEGKVAVATRDQGDLTLDAPTAFWARFFDKPVQPVGNATSAQLQTFLKSTELKPGTGVAIRNGRWRVVAAAPKEPAEAAALTRRLREAGYPALVRPKNGVHEVRINLLATKDDAAAVLKKIAAIEGVDGRVALSA